MNTKNFGFGTPIPDEDLKQIVTEHINRTDNPHKVTKALLGLDNVDNTADINKPLSDPTKEYITTTTPTKLKISRDTTASDPEDLGVVTVVLYNANDEVITKSVFNVDKVAFDYEGRRFNSSYASDIIVSENGDIELVSPDGTTLTQTSLPPSLESVTLSANASDVSLTFHMYGGSTLKCNLSTLVNYLTSLYLTKDEFSEFKAGLTTDLASLKKSIEDEIEELRTEIQTLTTSVNNKISDLKTYIDTKISDVTANLNSVKSTLDTKIDDTKKALQDTISDLQDHFERDISTLQSNINGLDNRITTIKEAYDTRLDAIDDQIADLIKSVKNQIEELDDTKVSKAAHTLALDVDEASYKYTFKLLDRKGNILSTQVLDLPIESLIVDGRYDAEKKAIILTLKNGKTIEIPVGDLISNLVTKDDLDVQINLLKTEIDAVKEQTSAALTEAHHAVTLADETLKHYQDDKQALVDDYTTKDAQIVLDYRAADEEIKTSYQAADSSIIENYKAADTKIEETLRKEYQDADSNLETKLRKEYQDADAEIVKDYKAADSKIIDEYKAADDQLKADLTKAIADLKKEIENTLESYLKKSDFVLKTINGQSIKGEGDITIDTVYTGGTGITVENHVISVTEGSYTSPDKAAAIAAEEAAKVVYVEPTDTSTENEITNIINELDYTD